MKIKYFLLFIMSLFSVSTVKAIEMKVGETKTLDVGNINNLQNAQWIISRPECIQFVTSPSYYSTSVNVKAVKAFSGSPCIVQCTYRYLELDPVTGRYTYSRSGYKSWSIYVSENSSGGSQGGDNPGGSNNPFIELNTSSVSCKLGNWSTNVKIYSLSNPNVFWSIDDPEVASIETIKNSGGYFTEGRVYGKREGKTTLRVKGVDGSSATCVVSVQPLSDGDTFNVSFGTDNNDVTYYYEVIDVDEKTCRLSSVWSQNLPDKIFLYNNVLGFEVTELKSNAFSGKKSLKSINIPSTIRYIGANAFYNCEALNKVEITDLEAWCNIGFSNDTSNPLYYAKHLYMNDNKIEELVIPNTTSKIGWRAFINCTDLLSVKVPNSVTNIGGYAFKNCINLESITLPDSINYIDDFVFYGCISLSDIQIPLSVKSIGMYSFYGCTSLTKIEFPKNLTRIGSAFLGCTNLIEISSLNIMPPSISSATFNDNTYETTTLRIPCKGKSAYVAHEYWGRFKHIVSDTLAPEKIILSTEVININIGDNFKLEATVVPEDATYEALVWSSDNNDVATIDENGCVSAHSLGTANITVTCGNLYASCLVTVIPVPIENLIINPEFVSLSIGESVVLTTTIIPDNTTNDTIFWLSNDESIVIVDAGGKVTAISSGEADIIALAADNTAIDAVCHISVKPIWVESITLNPRSWIGEEGVSFSIEASVLPDNATNKSLIWTSDDESIATVDSEGNVSILKEGNCTITATAVDGSDISEQCLITALSGIDNIFKDDDIRWDVFDLNGLLMIKDCDKQQLTILSPGIYILSQGPTSHKIIIR